MKKLLLIACVAMLSFGCDDKSGSSTTTSDSTKMSETKSGDLTYPYTLDKPYQDWQPGDQKHAVTVMNSLKAFENGDVPGSMTAFADSAEVFFDGFHEKFSHDSLVKYFTAERAKVKNIKIHMQDWESVISKDKKTEWVTMWYKEVMTDDKGKADSMAVVDDAKIENGKIRVLDEKVQHYPAPKK